MSTRHVPLSNLFSGVPEGERNSSLARLVGSFLHYFEADDVFTFALFVNSRYCPPLPDEEVFSIVKSISEKHQKKVQKIHSISSGGPLQEDPAMRNKPYSSSFLEGNGGQEPSADGFVPCQVYEGYVPPYELDMERIIQEEKERWRPIAVTEMQPPSEMMWYVKGYIANGLITELVAKLNPNASRKNWLLNF